MDVLLRVAATVAFAVAALILFFDWTDTKTALGLVALGLAGWCASTLPWVPQRTV